MKRITFYLTLLLLISAILFSQAPAAQAASSIIFATGTLTITGAQPYGLAVADINLDGKLDLVVPSQSNSYVGVYTGNGSGGFSTGATYTTGNAPHWVTVGDFNNDGKPDLATANMGGSISVLLANTSGGFNPKVDYFMSPGLWQIVTADFNRDGYLDLAATNNTTGTIYMLYGIGGGAFGSAVNYSGGANQGLAVGDFNRDGWLDLVYTSNNSYASYRYGSATGFSTTPNLITVGTSPVGVAVGDFNRDGVQDLVVANFGSNSVSLLLGNNSGGFAAKQDFAASAPQFIAVSDFDGDGKLDFAVTDNANNVVRVFRGDGAGGFPMQSSYSVNSNGPMGIAVGDANLDGKPDLFTADYSAGKVSFLSNLSILDPSGSFAAPANYSVVGLTRSVAAGDFNRDGLPDLAVTSGSTSVFIRLGIGNGLFGSYTSYSAGINPATVITGDFNRDGMLDLATANGGSNNVSLFTGKGDGTFNTALPFVVGTSPYGLAAGDFNNDGKPDLAVTNYTGNNVSVLLGNGTASIFNSATYYSTAANPFIILALDLDKDGQLELVVGTHSLISVLDNNGAGAFPTKMDYAAGSSSDYVAAGDFNGDGGIDLAATNASADTISVLLRSGTGYATRVTYPTGDNPLGIVAADFDRDGKLDLATANAASNNVSVLKGSGTGTFGTATNFAVGTLPVAIITSDLNLDGRPDLVTANQNSSNASVLFNQPQAPTISKAFGASPVNVWQPTALTFTISNPNPSGTSSLNGIGFTDNLPTGLLVDAAPSISNGCGGTLTSDAGSSTISLSSVTLASGANCTISVNVSSATGSVYNNTTGAISSNETGAGATSNTASLTVNKYSTTITLLSRPDPSTYGQTVAITATVSAAVNTPGGTVQFNLDGAPYGSPVTLGGGAAVTSASGLAIGDHTITASYSGSDSYLASTSATDTHTVSRAPATVQLSGLEWTYDSDPKSATATTTPGSLAVVITYDGSTTPPEHAGNYAVIATVTDPNYTGSITGTLHIAQKGLTVTGITASNKVYDGGITATLNISGAALSGLVPDDDVTLDVSSVAGAFDTKNVGTAKTVTASGLALTGADAANYSLSQPSNTASITPKALSVTAGDLSKVYGQALPALTYTFSGFVSGETAAVLSGVPALSTNAATTSLAGTYPITVTLGTLNAQNYTFTFTNGRLVIGQAETSTNLEVSAASIKAGQPVTITVTLSPLAPGAGIPTGQVTIKDGEVILGTVELVNGVAVITVTGLEIGTHSITAQYSGDGNFTSSAAPDVDLNVTDPMPYKTFLPVLVK